MQLYFVVNVRDLGIYPFSSCTAVYPTVPLKFSSNISPPQPRDYHKAGRNLRQLPACTGRSFALVCQSLNFSSNA